MNIAIIGDTHFGERGDNLCILDSSISFFEDQLIPELKKANIDTVIHCGDLMHKRKTVDYKTLSRVINIFEKFRESNIKIHLVIGNHDTYYRNTNNLNSVDLLFKEFSDILKVYKDPTNIIIGDTSFLLLPWINEENRDASLGLLKTSEANYVVGHLEINGFQMVKGLECTHGFKRSVFKRFKRVFSGHFHLRSYVDNIFYVGTPYELNWNDFGNIKGYHILDTETDELVFVENKQKMFHKIEWSEDLDVDDISDIAGSFVKIINNNGNSEKFEEFVSKVSTVAFESVVVEKTIQEEKLIEEVEVDEDTITFISNYIDASSIDHKDLVKQYMNDIYKESL